MKGASMVSNVPSITLRLTKVYEVYTLLVTLDCVQGSVFYILGHGFLIAGDPKINPQLGPSL